MVSQSNMNIINNNYVLTALRLEDPGGMEHGVSVPPRYPSCLP